MRARALVFVFCAVLCGCSAGGRDSASGTDAQTDSEQDAGGGANAGGGADGGDGNLGGPRLVAIALEPAVAELESVDGAQVEQQFRLIGKYEDGSQQQINYAGFELDALQLGSIDEESGLFVASGLLGGEVRVQARATSGTGTILEAEALLRVRVLRNIASADVSPEAEDRLAQSPVTDAARAASVVYPLRNALMPQNAFPADVQWLVGVENDLFEVRLDKPRAGVRVVLRQSGSGFGNHYLVDQTAWRMLAQSDPDAPVEVRVRRWEAASGELIEGTPRAFSFARAALIGSIYYWDIEAGRIVRIDDGTNKAVQFMPSPPMGLAGSVAEAPCVGCHAVSPSGRYMAGRLSGGENIGAVFDLTTDLTMSPAPTLFPIIPANNGTGSAQWWFASWSPDETRMVASTYAAVTGQLAMLNPFTGAPVAVSGSMPSKATHPAWSPDGTEIAYVGNIDIDHTGVADTAGDIAILPVTAQDTVGMPRVIHEAATLSASAPGGQVDSYPSWTPDSSSIAFGHGTGSRSQDKKGALYLMERDGSGVVRLDKACGGKKRTDNFQPRFSPFDSGGYFWLSFLSRRPYGNAEVGTRGKGYQQIWVTAIKKDAAPGEDPSRVAYWVPGQSTASRNISAYWAPRPCRKDGEACSVGTECCGGDCRPDSAGELVCTPPPADSCRKSGQTCSGSTDCCGSQLCEGNVCITPIF